MCDAQGAGRSPGTPSSIATTAICHHRHASIAAAVAILSKACGIISASGADGSGAVPQKLRAALPRVTGAVFCVPSNPFAVIVGKHAGECDLQICEDAFFYGSEFGELRGPKVSCATTLLSLATTKCLPSSPPHPRRASALLRSQLRFNRPVY